MCAAAFASLWPEFFLLSMQQDYFKRLMHVTFCKFLLFVPLLFCTHQLRIPLLHLNKRANGRMVNDDGSVKLNQLLHVQVSSALLKEVTMAGFKSTKGNRTLWELRCLTSPISTLLFLPSQANSLRRDFLCVIIVKLLCDAEHSAERMY